MLQRSYGLLCGPYGVPRNDSHHSVRPEKYLLFAAIVMVAAAVPVGASSASAANVIDDWAKIKVPPPPALNSVTVNPKMTVPLVLHFTHQICNEKRKPRCIAPLPAVKNPLKRARGNQVMVVYSTSGKMTPKDIWAEIAPKPGDPVISSHANNFQCESALNVNPAPFGSK